MKYVLIDWRSDNETSDSVTFYSDDQVVIGSIKRLTDRLIITLLRHLNEAKQADPSRLFLPMIHQPSKTGAEIRVVRDAFVMFSPKFRGMVQDCINEL